MKDQIYLRSQNFSTKFSEKSNIFEISELLKLNLVFSLLLILKRYFGTFCYTTLKTDIYFTKFNMTDLNNHSVNYSVDNSHYTLILKNITARSVLIF